MGNPRSAVQEIATELVTPAEGEVLRAKQELLSRLSDGTPVSTTDLINVLVDQAGIARLPSHDDRIDVPVGTDPHERLDVGDPVIRRERLKLATMLGLADLVAEGVLISVDGPENVYVTIPVQLGTSGIGVQVPVGRPRLGSGYQLAYRFGSDQLPILDADVFSADLANLGLDRRVLDCLSEALQAYRRGLYLSALNMIGAVSEGAWYAAAERLRGRSSELDRAIDDDQTATTIRLTADLLATGKRLRTVAAELHSHASYLRDLRNYGVHPRPGDGSAGMEHAFTEAGCALVLLETYRYLGRLAGAVDQFRGS